MHQRASIWIETHVYFAAVINLHAVAPKSESRERRLKAATDDEHDDEEDEDVDRDPPISEKVRRAGGCGSRGFGKS